MQPFAVCNRRTEGQQVCARVHVRSISGANSVATMQPFAVYNRRTEEQQVWARVSRKETQETFKEWIV